jgi:flagellar basal body-associated protein FliL
MADKEDTEQQEKKEESKAEKEEKKSLISRLLPIVIIVIVVGVCASAGFGLGRFLGGSRAPSEPGSEANGSDMTDTIAADIVSGNDSGDVWYYDLEPIIANLNEPNITRYVSATLTFEISSSLDEKKGRKYLDEKKPIIINWLTIYLSGLGLEDIRGDKNLMTIKSNIRDSLNEKLFPDSKPPIKDVLIQKFPVQ